MAAGLRLSRPMQLCDHKFESGVGERLWKRRETPRCCGAQRSRCLLCVVILGGSLSPIITKVPNCWEITITTYIRDEGGLFRGHGWIEFPRCGICSLPWGDLRLREDSKACWWQAGFWILQLVISQSPSKLERAQFYRGTSSPIRLVPENMGVIEQGREG